MTCIEILESKFKVKCEDEDNAKRVLSMLESYSSKGLYEKDKNGKIKGFYSKVMVDMITEEYKIISFGDQEYTFKEGYYQKNKDIKNFIHAKLSVSDKSRMRNLKESLDDLKVTTEIDPNLINDDDNIINFKNGLYDIKNKRMLNHDSNILSTIQINGNYKENKTGIKNSLFWKYLNTSFNPEMIPVIQELFGYCLTSKTNAEKMFILLGDGNNGKSVFINILNSFYDENFISSVELKDLAKHEFVARLHNKALNTCADLGAKYIEDTGLLKQLFGQDKFEARPLYSNPFRFRNRSKMIFSCNELPQTSDKTLGWFRRLVIINCNKKIDEKNKIDNLDKLIIKNDKDVIIDWAIEGLNRLIENKYKFSETEETQQSLNEYKDNSNSLKQFINTFCIIGENKGKISKSEFTEMYYRFCKSENMKQYGSRNVNSTMKELDVKAVNYEVRYWKCISWNHLIKELSNNQKVPYVLTGTVKQEIFERLETIENKEENKKIKYKCISANNLTPIAIYIKENETNTNVVKGRIFLDNKNNVCIPTEFNQDLKIECTKSFTFKGQQICCLRENLDKIKEKRQVKLTI